MEKIIANSILAFSLGILLFVAESIYVVFEYNLTLNKDDIIIKYIFWTQIVVIYVVSATISLYGESK